MRRADIVVGVALLIFSGLVFVQAGTYATRGVQIEYFGPAFFPQILSVAIAVCAVVQIAAALKGNALRRLEFIDGRGLLRMMAVFALGVVYWATIEWTGFVVATPPFLFLVMTVMGSRDLVKRIAASVAAPLVLWLVFEKFLVIDLPQGALVYALFGE
jgi:putative tricarboxylic transport membrane protein